MTTEDERRSEPRIETRISVDYAAEGTFLFAYITDISSMGIFIQTDKPLEVGTHIDLRFDPSDAVREAASEAGSGSAEFGPLELGGTVVWNTANGGHQGNPGMGVKFLDLGAQQRSRLLDLVRAIAYLDDRDGN